MKRLYFFFLLITCFISRAQEKSYVLIDVQTKTQVIVHDSLSAVKFLDSLAQNHYFLTDITKVEKKNRVTNIFYDKKQNFNEAKVILEDKIAQDLRLNKNFKTKNLDSLKAVINNYYAEEGFTFNRIKSQFQGFDNYIPKVFLNIDLQRRRRIDKLVLKNYTKLPRKYVQNLEQKYLKRPYNRNELSELNTELQTNTYINLEKPPQSLFRKDSTEIYLFFKKRNTNVFDGLIGFGTTDSAKFTVNGSLNLELNNIFNDFEKIGLSWNRTPNGGQTFNLTTDIPYLFRSNIGANINFNIYRQDSLFTTVQATPGIYYQFRTAKKLGIRGRFEKSVVSDSLLYQGRDYSKKGIGLWFSMATPADVEIFQNKNQINFSLDFLNAQYTFYKQNQINYFIHVAKNFNVANSHYFFISGESAFTENARGNANELLRFGGWNSLRGFAENSLLANFYAYTTAEYRYLIESDMYFNIFGQYGILQNKNINLKKVNLYSLGFGLRFIIPLGLMSIELSNGTTSDATFNFKQTKISWGIFSRF